MKYSKGDIIDKYKVSLPLGRGRYTETYRVRDFNGRLAVLKLGVSDTERFLLSKAGMTEYFTESYVVMRYIPGETLEMRLRRERTLPPDIVIAIIKDILDTVAQLHACGYVHNAISSPNIMLDLGCRHIKASVIGYGAAEASDKFTADCVALGKLIYMMLTGESLNGPIKVRTSEGKEANRLNGLMIKALSEDFSSAGEMKAFLDSDSAGDIIRKPVGPGFSAVAGMGNLKQRLKDDVIDILANKEEAEKYGLNIPNGMLLYGPPGCGKTFISEKFAEEAAYNYKYVKTSDLASTYLHGSQEKIADLFNEARRNAPTILCIDEFDALVPKRDAINNASQSAEVNEFLSQLNNCGKDGIFVIATTNRPDKIDSAVLRSGRLDYKIFVPVPDLESRKALFQVILKGRPTDASIDFVALAKATEGYLSSDISSIIQIAAREAFRSKSAITYQILLNAVRSTPPSLSKTQLKEYDKLRDEFERNEKNDNRRRVGFLAEK